MSDTFSTPWTVAHQVSLSMGFLRQEYWSGLPFLSPGDLPDSGIEPMSSALVGGFFATELPTRGFPSGSDGKESACNAGVTRFEPWVMKIPWRKEWQPTPVFLPGEFHEQRSVVGYSPWGCKRVGHD